MGLTVGIIVGAVTDNMGLWISIGTVFGLVFGAAIATVLASQEAEV
tara:strand:- start:54 stop:191 length:138 start_codon:yes stop_codon:yes gene_type:complete